MKTLYKKKLKRSTEASEEFCFPEKLKRTLINPVQHKLVFFNL